MHKVRIRQHGPIKRRNKTTGLNDYVHTLQLWRQLSEQCKLGVEKRWPFTSIGPLDVNHLSALLLLLLLLLLLGEDERNLIVAAASNAGVACAADRNSQYSLETTLDDEIVRHSMSA
mmetsp:Transcript_60446/g.132308  ORF Transcript_60446/g.132308 Transcript_60446/m.132308 type:complete len:117 (+) Transcript_60446:24-374(+)